MTGAIMQFFGKTDVKNVMGKRVLARVANRYGRDEEGDLREIRVVEISPSGNYVMIDRDQGYGKWYPIKDIKVIELLEGPNPSRYLSQDEADRIVENVISTLYEKKSMRQGLFMVLAYMNSTAYDLAKDDIDIAYERYVTNG